MLSIERKQINYRFTILESIIEFNLRRMIMTVRRKLPGARYITYLAKNS
jgi:hypothetical protein